MDAALERLYREALGKAHRFSFTSFVVGTLVGIGIGMVIYYFGEEMVGRCFAFVINGLGDWVADSWARHK